MLPGIDTTNIYGFSQYITLSLFPSLSLYLIISLSFCVSSFFKFSVSPLICLSPSPSIYLFACQACIYLHTLYLPFIPSSYPSTGIGMFEFSKHRFGCSHSFLINRPSELPYIGVMEYNVTVLLLKIGISLLSKRIPILC